jgi:hypothetical protein
LNVNILHLPFRRAEREKIALWAILTKSLPAGRKGRGRKRDEEVKMPI